MASYAAFATGLLWTALAVVHLYRRDQLRPLPLWPSDRLVPGRALPRITGVTHEGRQLEIAEVTDALVVLLTDPILQAYATIVAARVGAERHGLGSLLVLDEAMLMPEGWEGLMPASIAESTVRVPSRALRSLRLRHPLILVVVRRGFVRDAIAGPRTLPEIEDRFGVFLGDARAFAAAGTEA